MTPRGIPVLYIAGAGRSGSTLIELILGNLPSFFSVGEIRFFWEYWRNREVLCGCGARLRSCPVWAPVHERLAAELGPERLDAAARLARRLDRSRKLLGVTSGTTPRRPDHRELVRLTAALYRQVHRESGRKILVDSSKVPTHLDLLLRADGLDLRVLHLVRDGRAVAYSWSHRQKRELGRADGAAKMPRRGLVRSMVTWGVENSFARFFGRRAEAYTVLRYEDFTRRPGASLGRALDDLGLGPVDLSGLTFGDATVEPTHSVGGNPMRFASRKLRIELHEEWRRELSPTRRLLLTILGTPWLRSFGYTTAR